MNPPPRNLAARFAKTQRSLLLLAWLATLIAASAMPPMLGSALGVLLLAAMLAWAESRGVTLPAAVDWWQGRCPFCPKAAIRRVYRPGAGLAYRCPSCRRHLAFSPARGWHEVDPGALAGGPRRGSWTSAPDPRDPGLRRGPLGRLLATKEGHRRPADPAPLASILLADDLLARPRPAKPKPPGPEPDADHALATLRRLLRGKQRRAGVVYLDAGDDDPPAAPATLWDRWLDV